MPQAVEWYLYLAHSGTVLGPWTSCGMRKWNHWQAYKRRFCSEVCRTWAVLGVFKQNIKTKIKRCVVNQHLVMWRSLSSTWRQARKPISGPSPTTETRFLSFHRTQSRVVIGLLTGHNTMRRHLHLVGLTSSPLCRRCGAEEGTTAQILCECKALALLRHTYLGSFFLNTEDIESSILGAIWNFSKGTRLPWPGIRLWGAKGKL